MPDYNKLTPALAEELRQLLGEKRFQYGEGVKEA